MGTDPELIGGQAALVAPKMLSDRCICSDHSCYCRDYARGWNDALQAVADAHGQSYAEAEGLHLNPGMDMQ